MKIASFKHALFALGLLATSPLPASAAEEESTRVAVLSPSGTWNGTWTNSRGFQFDAVLRIAVAADRTVSGEIGWTIVKTPTGREKLGTTAVEHIEGTYDPETQTLTFRGFRKDDPNSIIGLDKYRLQFSKTGDKIEGATENHGDWGGVFVVTPGTAKK